MDFTHFNAKGRATMVDVGGKSDSERAAVARATVFMQPATLAAIQNGGVKKGDVLAVAQVAGIMAAKRTSEVIPMCHPLMLTSVDIDFTLDPADSCVQIQCLAKTSGKTGVEMEAINGASAAAMTIYDMCKAIDRWMTIGNVQLIEKRGGKSGHVRRHQLPVVCFVSACSNTGKTTVMENVIKSLVRSGYKVGAIKSDCHGFSMDVPGKDSWRFTQAGAAATAVIGPDQWAMVQQTATKSTLTAVTNRLEAVDIILVEGFKYSGQPVIEVVRREKGTKLASPADRLFAVVTDVEELTPDVPVFRLDDYEQIAAFVITKFLGA